jgi:purine-binding chemotaxis protein CheW
MPRTRRPAVSAAAAESQPSAEVVTPAEAVRPRRTRARAANAPAEPSVAAAHVSAPMPALALVESAPEPAVQAEPATSEAPPFVAATSDLSGNGIRQYLTFVVDGQEYGIEIHQVQEIRGYTNVTPLPNTPPHIKGLMNLRGAVIPIFDLRAWFGGGQAECTRTSVIVTVTVGERLVGLLVDAVSDVLDVEGRSLAPPPDLGPGVDTTLLAGLATVGERLVAVIKVEELVGGMMAA